MGTSGRILLEPRGIEPLNSDETSLLEQEVSAVPVELASSPPAEVATSSALEVASLLPVTAAATPQVVSASPSKVVSAFSPQYGGINLALHKTTVMASPKGVAMQDIADSPQDPAPPSLFVSTNISRLKSHQAPKSEILPGP